MKDRARFLGALTLSGAMFLGGRGVMAQEPSSSFSPSLSPVADTYYDPANYDWQVSVMAPRSIITCYSNQEPQLVTKTLQDETSQKFVDVYDADCLEITPDLTATPYEGLTLAEIDDRNGIHDIVNLADLRAAGASIPPIFNNQDDQTSLYQ